MANRLPNSNCPNLMGLRHDTELNEVAIPRKQGQVVRDLVVGRHSVKNQVETFGRCSHGFVISGDNKVLGANFLGHGLLSRTRRDGRDLVAESSSQADTHLPKPANANDAHPLSSFTSTKVFQWGVHGYAGTEDRAGSLQGVRGGDLDGKVLVDGRAARVATKGVPTVCSQASELWFLVVSVCVPAVASNLVAGLAPPAVQAAVHDAADPDVITDLEPLDVRADLQLSKHLLGEKSLPDKEHLSY